MSEEANVIYVGRKAVMNYVLAVLLQFDAGAKKVILKARGKAISKAVDVAEIVKRRLLENKVDITQCKIDTEEVGEDPNIRKVSTIEIWLEAAE